MDRQRAGDRSDALHAGKQPDPARAETKIVRADDRDQAQARPAEQVEDDGDHQQADQAPFAPDEGDRTEDVLEQRARTVGRGRIAVADSRGRQDGDEVQDRAERKAALDPEGNQDRAADRGPRHAARIVGADIEDHGLAHAVCADDTSDHEAAERHVGRPDRPRDQACDGEVPDREMARMGEQGERDRRRQQGERGEQQNDASLQDIRRRADEGSEQRHGQDPQHRHDGDEERRAGLLVHEDADRQHLDPAHGELDRADQPQPPEIGLRGPAVRPRRIRMRQLSCSRAATGVYGPLGHVPKKPAPDLIRGRAPVFAKEKAPMQSGAVQPATAGRPARNRRAARRLHPRAAVRSRPQNAGRPQTRRGRAGPASGSRHAHRSAA